MDSISSKIEFLFDNLRSEVEDESEDWQLLLRVMADFTVIIDGERYYTESEFPVVEFASQAAGWLRNDQSDFRYVSMESAEIPLLGFAHHSGGTFTPHSPIRKHGSVINIGKNELRNALSIFIFNLRKELLVNHSLDVSRLL